MCSNCARYRHPAAHAACHYPVPPATEDSFFQTHMSRARMLKSVGGVMGATLTAGLLDWTPAPAAASELPYVVLIVLDGARPEYLTFPGLPHVQALMRNGTQYTNAFAGILESETPSGHVAIGTGSEPARTGIPSFWWADKNNVRVSLFSPTKIRAGDMEALIRKSGVPTLAGLVHAKSSGAKVVALSGSKYYAADAIGGPDADITMYFHLNSAAQWSPTYIPGHAPSTTLLNTPGLTIKGSHMTLGRQNHLAMQLAAESFRATRQQVTLINLPEFDWPLGHVNGGTLDPRMIATLMHGFDADLGALQDTYRKAGVLDRTIFVLMSDHGMMPLRHTVSQDEIKAAVARAGAKLVTDAYTSGVFLWLTDKAKAGPVAGKVAALNNPAIQSVYARVRTAHGFSFHRVAGGGPLRAPATEGANQFLLNTFNGSNAPDVVAVLAEGAGCEPGGQAHWKADHGGTSWQAQRIPLIMSGAGVRAGRVSSYPARLIDVAPTILQLMGASHTGMQGIPLADALQSAPSWAVKWQQSAARRVMPVVAALQVQSRYELGKG